MTNNLTGMRDRPRPTDEFHPDIERLLGYFAFGDLPGYLGIVVKPFCDLAWDLAAQFDGPAGAQLRTALEALMVAKDEAQRCAMDQRRKAVKYSPGYAVGRITQDTAAAVLTAHEAGGTDRG